MHRGRVGRHGVSMSSSSPSPSWNIHVFTNLEAILNLRLFKNRSQSPVLLLPEAGSETPIKYLVVLMTSSHPGVPGVGRGMALVVKNLPASAGDVGDTGSIPESGKAPGEGHGNPLQYSCLENLMDRGAWWVTVHRITQSQIKLKRLCEHELRP